jgi:nickel/cobalt exporter
MAQAAGAILLILVASMLLHLTSVSITLATFQFEVISDSLVLLLGCWLIWAKIIKPALSLKLAFEPVTPLTRPELYLDVASAGQSRFQASEVVSTSSGLSLRQAELAAPTSDQSCDCGVLHIPDAAMAAGTLDWRRAWTIVASTAMRPCTGALIVLVFAISQGLLAAGIASALMMGFGTAITVTALAVLAVSARKAAFVLTGTDSMLGRRIKRGVEVCGAVVVLVVGVLLLLGDIFMQ